MDELEANPQGVSPEPEPALPAETTEEPVADLAAEDAARSPPCPSTS